MKWVRAHRDSGLQHGAPATGPPTAWTLRTTVSPPQLDTRVRQEALGWYLFVVEMLTLVPHLFYTPWTQAEIPCQSLGEERELVL